MENKDFLIKKLQLTNAIIKDLDNAIELAKEFKNLTKEQQNGITDLISKYIDNESKIETIKQVINVVDIVDNDREYLLGIIELKQLANLRDSKNFNELIKEKLQQDHDFKDELRNYVYYSLIVNIVIGTNDSELIELAIEKLQNI